MRQSAVLFEAKGLKFQGVVGQPEEGGRPCPAVVLCHPHPLFGGNVGYEEQLAGQVGEFFIRNLK